MSDSFALIPKTITGSWGSEWECCNVVIALLLDKVGHSARENQVDRLLPLAKGFLCCLIHAKWISLCLCLLPNREHPRDSGILMTPWNGKWGSRDGFLKSGEHVNHWLEKKLFPSGMVVKLGANSLPPAVAVFCTIRGYQIPL